MEALTRPAPLGPDPVLYPVSDGDPMPEGATHRIEMAGLIFALRRFFARHPAVHIDGNVLIYYHEGYPNERVSPDAFVTLNVPRGHREAYFVWVEGKFPDLVVEIVSPNNTERELREKRRLYARLGAREYVIFDPLELRSVALEGFAFADGHAAAMPTLDSGGLWSDVLGAELRMVARSLRVIDPATGAPIPVPEELDQSLDDAQARANQEIRVRRAAEARADQEAHVRRAAEARADQEARVRRAAEARADQEARVRQEAEARAAESEEALRVALAELERLRRQRD